MAPRRRQARRRAAAAVAAAVGFQPAELEALPDGPAEGQEAEQGLDALDAELPDGQEILGIQLLVARIYGQLQNQRPITWSFENRRGDLFCSTLTITHDGSSFTGDWTVGKRLAMRSVARAAWRSLRALELGLEVEDAGLVQNTPARLPRTGAEGDEPLDAGLEEVSNEEGVVDKNGDKEGVNKELAGAEGAHEEDAPCGKDVHRENGRGKDTSVNSDEDTEVSLRFLAGEFDHVDSAHVLSEDGQQAAPVSLASSKAPLVSAKRRRLRLEVPAH
mmetsp:Transcript_74254/g.172245  ORF Transcript_74254/g.172245 Transcript_74254/m.172245 type:complete len:275 (+) Transcript_74254:235-1059(+)